MVEEVRVPKRPIWSGRITIGLVNVPVKLYGMIFDKSVTFKFLHKIDGSPLKYQKVCIKEDKVVPWEDVVKGYEISKNQFVIFDKEELKAARPESDQRIRVDKFVDYLSLDPIYFETSYILTPEKSNDAYSLLFAASDSYRLPPWWPLASWPLWHGTDAKWTCGTPQAQMCQVHLVGQIAQFNLTRALRSGEAPRCDDH